MTTTAEKALKYWLDECPVCKSECVSACRCPRSERWCKNGHNWRRFVDGSFVLLDSPHGKEIDFDGAGVA